MFAFLVGFEADVIFKKARLTWRRHDAYVPINSGFS